VLVAVRTSRVHETVLISATRYLHDVDVCMSMQDKSFLTAVTSALGDDSSDGGDNANTDEDCDYEN
jgi:hypothetical protein